MKLSKQDRELLAAIAADPRLVMFEHGHRTPPTTRDRFTRLTARTPDASGYVSPIPLWVTCTAPVRRLLAAGLVEHAERSGSWVTATQRGKDWLAAA